MHENNAARIRTSAAVARNFFMHRTSQMSTSRNRASGSKAEPQAKQPTESQSEQAPQTYTRVGGQLHMAGVDEALLVPTSRKVSTLSTTSTAQACWQQPRCSELQEVSSVSRYGGAEERNARRRGIAEH